MSTLFNYAVNFKEKDTAPPISLTFLHKVGVFVGITATPPLSESISEPISGELITQTAIESDQESDPLALEYSTDESEDVVTTKTSSEEEKQGEAVLMQDSSISPASMSADYVMIEVTELDYLNYTDNTEIQGFFDGGMSSIYLLMNRDDGLSVAPDAQAADPDLFDTVCWSTDFTISEALAMDLTPFDGQRIATSSIESEAEQFLSVGPDYFCFLDSLGSAYGMANATGYHLTRTYWRNNQYMGAYDPAKVGAVVDATYGRVLLEKGISFFIKDETAGTYLGFFGNPTQGIAKPYIDQEIQLKVKERLTLWTQREEPTDTAMNRALAQREGNEELAKYEVEPYLYLDPDYRNRIKITESNEMYHANGDYEVKIPQPIWVYDIESQVV